MANNTFQIKRTTISGRTPNTTSSANSSYINIGELALNLTDSILYSANSTSGLITVGSNLTSTSIGGGALIANSSRITITGVPLSANGSVGTQGQVLASNGSTGSPYWKDDATGGGGGSPGGSTTQIQFNDASAFGGSAGFTFNKTTNNVTIANTLFVTTRVNTATLDVTSRANVGANVQLSTSNLSIANSTFRVDLTAKTLVIDNLAAQAAIVNSSIIKINGPGGTSSSMDSNTFGFGFESFWTYDAPSSGSTLYFTNGGDGSSNLVPNGLTLTALDGYGTPTGSYTVYSSGTYGSAIVSYYAEPVSLFTYNFALGPTKLSFSAASRPNLINLYIDTPDAPTGTYNTGQLDLFKYSATNLNNKDKGMSVVSDRITAYTYDSGGVSSTVYEANGSGFYHTGTVNIGNSTVNSTINSTSFKFSDSTTQTSAATLGIIYATAAGFAMP